VELGVAIGAALAVQLVFPYRHDWPAHLLGGAGAMILGAAAAPRALHRLTASIGFVALVALSWATEVQIFHPFDLVDAAFTLAGAVLTFQAADQLGRCRGRPRAVAAAWGAALVVASLWYRYGTSVGPT